MSGERIIPEEIKSQAEYFIYLKEVFVYDWCGKFISKDSLCLDLGCGDGYGTKMLALSAREVIGIDKNKNVINNASDKYGGDNCSFKYYNGKIIPFPSNTFDIVFSFHVIEHVRNDLNFISESYRVLKNNGIFILTTPNKILRLPNNIAPWNVFHIREYEPRELKILLEKKFKEVEILGISAVSDVKKIEEERIRKNVRIVSYDYLNLRRLLPVSITSVFVKVLRSLGSYRNEPHQKFIPAANDRYSLIYRIEELDPENSLDILGVGKK